MVKFYHYLLALISFQTSQKETFFIHFLVIFFHALEEMEPGVFKVHSFTTKAYVLAHQVLVE